MAEITRACQHWGFFQVSVVMVCESHSLLLIVTILVDFVVIFSVLRRLYTKDVISYYVLSYQPWCTSCIDGRI